MAKHDEQWVRKQQTALDVSEYDDAISPATMQSWIDSGEVWRFEGHMGREAMRCLELGLCFLPKHRTQDFYGNTIPSRDDLKAGTKGTLENAIRYWEDLA